MNHEWSCCGPGHDPCSVSQLLTPGVNVDASTPDLGEHSRDSKHTCIVLLHMSERAMRRIS